MRISLYLTLLALILLNFNSCCKPKTVIKKEYIKCKYPPVLDLNYTNDTNYTIAPIEYEIIAKKEAFRCLSN